MKMIQVGRVGVLLKRGFSSALKRTPLHEFHLENKGKMVDFAGWALPVQYGGLGVLGSVKHTRAQASLFDVSHMGQVLIEGPERVAFAEKGTIIDDCVISNRGDYLYLVVNAGTCEKDLAHMRRELAAFRGQASLTLLMDTALLALQGPRAVDVLARHASLTEEEAAGSAGSSAAAGAQPASASSPFQSLTFMTGATAMIGAGAAGAVPCLVTRCGYTGEDGFEVSVAAEHVEQVARALVAEPECELAGLGARDALRLEAGLCLYGHDIDETTSPVEAGLHFALPKSRRESGGYIGAPVVQQQLADPKATSRRRVGMIIDGPPAREGAKVFASDAADGDLLLGQITSGCHSPTLQQSISMGYVRKTHMKAGSQVQVEIRNKLYPATVTKTPFVKQNYYRGEANAK